MGDEYKCNPRQLYHQHYSFQQRTTTSTFLLPMLCRLSIKDVKLKRCKDRSANEPSSPKVSCIGQVKRRNSKIHVGFPTPISSNHTKLKRFFSGKNLTTTGDGENCCRELLRRNTSATKLRKVKSDDHVGVNVSELDPPLPVVKRVQQRGGSGGEVSLWNRRSGGASLKTLQIQHIHLPNNNQIIPPTTV